MDKTPASIVAGNVRAELGRRGITVLALAEATGISRSTLMRRLSGQASPLNIDELTAIASHLNINLGTLIGIEQDA
ncbi:helix-turn-helix domain-containing protein [Rhodococcoides kyotonense]|uniref:Cro/C1-type HTH DNA-binding domain-containing protein n=1 Tax=Rhodococcoides kyotonense TaxID=398843 RepID=A0A239FTZ8_9NOCA|nr:helix-turn-helix transcriptional regulator [Rhodococcus kyotonensis]SNS59632.1 Cro/C1-type HTH DNA-binding domain-containing protein [Rhodococcus kyotonensis]